MLPKQFLLSECKNLQAVLQETLRFDYGLDSSKDFYDECNLRLNYITTRIQKTDETNGKDLMGHSQDLNRLSKLISRIERSSISEYSWPFVSAFKDITYQICKEERTTGQEDPRIHVISEGGLASYMIYGEGDVPTSSNQKILTIVFPRTLKHFVLLHPILGHEIGHALLNMTKHANAFQDIVDAHLTSKSNHFVSEDSIASWLYSSSAPDDIQRQLLALGELDPPINQSNFFKRIANLGQWIEEILCDIIGVLIFGPSFIGAHTHLLPIADIDGLRLSRNHPPTALRIDIMLRVADVLGWDVPNFGNEVDPHAKAFWASVNRYRKTDAWYDVFPNKCLKDTLDAFKFYLSGFENTLYPEHNSHIIEKLSKQIFNLIPPVGSGYDDNGMPDCKDVDFRHILYAGWIASEYNPEQLDFSLVNRLCEHGIMQQRAIYLKNHPVPLAEETV